MVKQCTQCKIYKDIQSFSKNSKYPDSLDYWCKQCWAAYRKKYRLNKLYDSRQYTNYKRQQRISWFQQLKKNKPCYDCGKIYEPYCMDYDHDPYKGKKIKSISRMVLDNTAKSKILYEIKKCQLVCLLCHNKRTNNRIGILKGSSRKYKNHHIRNINIINNFKNTPCVFCGQQYELYNMQFDHINPANKLYNVSELKSRKLNILLAELKKCQVLCALCHRKKSILEQKSNLYSVTRIKVVKKKLFFDANNKLKECGICHLIKPINLFRLNSKTTSGIDTYCKQCFNQYKKEKRKSHK